MRRPTTSTRKPQCRAPRTVCRTSADVVARFAQGAKTVIIDSPADQILELHDLIGTGTQRITGTSRVRITTSTGAGPVNGFEQQLGAVVQDRQDAEVEERVAQILDVGGEIQDSL